MEEVDFTEADMTEAILKGSDLRGAVFDSSILRAADFREAYNFRIDPTQNIMQKAIFSKNSIEGLLSYLNIIIEA